MKEFRKSKDTSFVKSAALHISLAALLLLSFDFSSQPTQIMVNATQPEIIEATFVDSSVLQEKKREREQAQAQARANEKARQERQLQEQREREKQAREKRKKQKALEEQKQKEIAQQKEQQRLKAQEQQRIKEQELAKIEEEKREALEQKKRDEARKKEEQEEAARVAAKQQFVLTETDKYIGLIKQVIQRNLIFDPSAQVKECRLNIRMSSNGLVFDVKILSGDPALCRAAQAAVLRPDSLPVSKDPDVYETLRDFNLTVEL